MDNRRAATRLSERAYALLFEDEGDRVCRDISEDQCRSAPRNFGLNAANGAATKFAEQLASPDLTLPWMLSAIGAPIALTGLLVPLRRAGSLLPQLAASGAIRELPVRKNVWVISAVVQTLALLLMAASVALLSGVAAGIVVAALLGVFSIASGVASVSYKDVLAKTIPKGRRGRLLAVRATVGGALTLGAGLVLFLLVSETGSRLPYVILVAGAGLLFGVAAVLFSRVRELPGATSGGRTPFQELRAAWELLQSDRPFRRFVAARALLLTVLLMQPFYVVLSKRFTGDSLGALGAFVIAAGIGRMAGGPVWGGLADRAAHRAMLLGGLLAVAAAGWALAFGLLPEAVQRFYLFAPVFIINAIAYAGIRLGRKTWLVDYASADERPLYVSLANTLAGAAMLAGSLYGIVAGLAGATATVVVGGVALLAGTALSATLPAVSEY
jgi:MFS family permease